MEWSNKKLYQLVEALEGTEQAEKLSPALYSIPWKFSQANYFAEEALQVIQRVLPDDRLKAYVKLVKNMLGVADDELKSELSQAEFKSECYIIGFAHIIHSVSDIMAQIIYYALNLKKKLGSEIPEQNRKLSTILKKLEKLNLATNLQSLIEQYLNSPEYKYLNAYTNTIKHRSLIDRSYYLSAVPPYEHGFKIEEFKYKGENFSSKMSCDFTGSNFLELKKKIINIGNEINNFLEEQLELIRDCG
jgi:hypothetical protein